MSLKKGVALNSQQKVRFRGYFKYFLTGQKYEQINHSKVVKKLISHINNSKKLLKNG